MSELRMPMEHGFVWPRVVRRIHKDGLVCQQNFHSVVHITICILSKLDRSRLGPVTVGIKWLLPVIGVGCVTDGRRG